MFHLILHIPPKAYDVVELEGIGRAVVKHLAAPLQRCNVLAVARDEQALKELQAEHDGNVEPFAADLSDLDLAPKAVQAALDRWGRLDALVVNHGRLEPVDSVADADLAEWRRTFDVNVLSGVALVRAALPALRESKGRVVLCSSGAAVKAYRGWAAYSASKAAVNSLALALAAEEPDVVTVALRPGVVATEMQDNMAKVHYEKMGEDAERFRKMREEGKMLPPEKPGNVMGRLALGATPELNGKFLSWDDKELKEFQDM